MSGRGLRLRIAIWQVCSSKGAWIVAIPFLGAAQGAWPYLFMGKYAQIPCFLFKYTAVPRGLSWMFRLCIQLDK